MKMYFWNQINCKLFSRQQQHHTVLGGKSSGFVSGGKAEYFLQLYLKKKIKLLNTPKSN